jgi:hypothetical protein
MSAQARIPIFLKIPQFFSFFPVIPNRRKGKKTKQISILGRARVGDNTLHVHQCFFFIFWVSKFGEISPKYSKISQIHTCKT